MVGGWEALSLVGKAPSDLYNSHDTAMGRRQCLPPKPYLFTHPNPTNAIISWTISWPATYYRLSLLYGMICQLIIALVGFGCIKR